MKDEFVVVMVTAPSVDEGAGIGRKVVEEGLSACCNIVPGVRSIYTWQGRICDEGEVLCIFKTRASLFERLKKRVKELHSYDVPEIIAVPVRAGLEEYLEWVRDVTVKE